MKDDRLSDRALRNMPSIAIRTLAQQIREYSEYLELQAELMAAKEERVRQMRNHKADLTKMLLTVEKLVTRGETIDNAMVVVAQENNVPLTKLLPFGPRLVALRNVKARGMRDRRIIDMHRRGLTDRQIAAKVGLHPKSVARIRRRINSILR